MAINIISTNGGTDFSGAIPSILINTAGDYVSISGVSGGTGDVIGPVGATANAVAIFNGTSGKLVKNSTMTIVGDDVTIAGNIDMAGTMSVGNGGGISSAAVGQEIQINASSGVSIGGNIANVTMGTSYPGFAQVTGGSDATLVAVSGTALLSSSAGPTTVHALTNILLDANAKLLINTPSVSGTIGNNTLLINNNVGFQQTWNDGGGNIGTIQNSAYPTMALSTPGGSGTFLACYPTQILTKGDFLPVGTSGTALIGTPAVPYGAVHSTALVVVSPNGSAWKLTVDNAGVVSGVSFP